MDKVAEASLQTELPLQDAGTLSGVSHSAVPTNKKNKMQQSLPGTVFDTRANESSANYKHTAKPDR